MTRHEIATLSLRLAALYAWFKAVELVSIGTITLLFVIKPAGGYTSPMAGIAYVLPALIFAVVGTLLFRRAPHWADRFLAPSAESISPSPGASVIPSLAFAVVGLLGAIYSLPYLAQTAIELLTSARFSQPTAKDEFLEELPAMASLFIQFALCWALVVYARSFAAWWERRQRSSQELV